MRWLRDLADQILGRRPHEAEPQPTEEEEYVAERQRELLRKHDERIKRGDDDPGRYQVV